MKTCLLCDNTIDPFVSFGKMPIANNFLSPEQFGQEYFFDLEVGFCESCGMVQLIEQVPEEKMFHDHYAFYSSTSARMAAHFETFATDVKRLYPAADDPLVVEIGCNDGIMLRHFASAGIRHLGVEPSANVARAASEAGLEVVSEFFDADLAKIIIDTIGPADAILGANVMCHIPYLHSVFQGVWRLLKPGGVFMFEDPYLGDIVRKVSYDQIYDEHVFYFCATSIAALAEKNGLELVDVAPQAVHGGSMRYTIARAGERPPTPSVTALCRREEQLGLHRPETYQELARRIQASRSALRDLLQGIASRGQRVVGYGATSKSTTVTNYCGITPQWVEFICDTTPIKQGKFSPGAHIPIRPHANFAADYPDYALLFAWNHAQEIMEKETAFNQDGRQWIHYVPEVKVY